MEREQTLATREHMPPFMALAPLMALAWVECPPIPNLPMIVSAICDRNGEICKLQMFWYAIFK